MVLYNDLQLCTSQMVLNNLCSHLTTVETHGMRAQRPNSSGREKGSKVSPYDIPDGKVSTLFGLELSQISC